ncbi:hypothetical protein CAPTEDRAFT_222416 [Capitella teleta]|uniref:Cyclic nucleotide-binding domain-containing protein n=1 Tax=Capitella teleta TaxID=283909 RepID=R7T798_CAPTE|nr:hypothetical protein CAPTEDRAFT_222416 [Capitella teleta]|eukprot:ELT89519.1 hypothetical protein CAPTEDRAFT_222416 [Capitella teleta]
MWDPEQRRKNIAKQTAAKDKYHQTLKRIAFIAQGDHIKSHYRRGQYNPAEIQPRTASAPPTLTHPSVNSSCPTTPVKATRSMSHQYRASTPRVTKKTRCIENVDRLCDPSKRNPVSAFDEDVGEPILNLDRGKKTIGFIRTPMLPSLNERAKSGSSTRKDPNLVALPRFVELESLHTGAIFGLRSCLVPEERGPSASLVSGGCQVIQISKKFFLAHADEAIYSLIKFKTKVFPEEEELLDRLNANYEWQEYKKQAMTKFLRMSSKYGSSYKYDLTVLG